MLVTVSDKKIGVDGNTDGTIDYYNADVVTATDFYPFGMMMPGRKYAAEGGYRYGFNGKENDNEVKGEGNQQDYGLRVYDPRLGRFLSVDPLEEEYPELTPYQFASNRPIDGIDLDGAEWSKAQLEEALAQAKAKLGTLATESAIVSHGFGNAFANANSFGASDNLPDWTGLATDNLDDYDNDYDKSLYLYGRILGDVAAGLQGLSEISGGAATAAAGGTASATGIGAVAGAPTAVVGGIVAGHGALVGASAATDIGWALKKLAGLQDGIDNSKTVQQTPEQSTNQQTQSAHQKKQTATESNTASDKQKNLAEARKKGIPENQLGPSGKPKVHIVEKPNLKRAREAARNNPKSNSKPLKHSSDKGQKTHFHSTKKGQKLKGKDNVHYTDRSSKKNKK